MKCWDGRVLVSLLATLLGLLPPIAAFVSPAGPLSPAGYRYDAVTDGYDVLENISVVTGAADRGVEIFARRTDEASEQSGAFSGRLSAPRALDDVVVIGKVDDLASTTLRPGERTLLDQLPNQGSPRLNYAQNSSVLRREMGRGVPIRDASVDPVTGALRNNTGFLRAERDILTYRGWTFDSKSGYWMPPR